MSKEKHRGVENERKKVYHQFRANVSELNIINDNED